MRWYIKGRFVLGMLRSGEGVPSLGLSEVTWPGGHVFKKSRHKLEHIQVKETKVRKRNSARAGAEVVQWLKDAARNIHQTFFLGLSK